MARRVHVLVLPVRFPGGIAAGDGGDSNHLVIARNGQGEPILRGTALAGRLRSSWKRRLFKENPDEAANRGTIVQLFGEAAGNYSSAASVAIAGKPSALQVGDTRLLLPRKIEATNVVERTHNLRDRHTGTVLDGGLFSLEACAPNTTARITLWLHDDAATPELAQSFLSFVVARFERGITLGGKSARGVGLAQLQLWTNPKDQLIGYRVYDLQQVESYADYLDDHRSYREDPDSFVVKEPSNPPWLAAARSSAMDDNDCLQVNLTLGIPRGQDLLIGETLDENFTKGPQRVRSAGGEESWRLPGSTLRGLFRNWFTRLAARSGSLPIADSIERRMHYEQTQSTITDKPVGDNLGWSFLSQEDRKKPPAQASCPIAQLFGTVFHAGRIHISDAYSPVFNSTKGTHKQRIQQQERTHVAIDPISGGAIESRLFTNNVLVSSDSETNNCHVLFEVKIQIQSPREQEVDWLAKTLRALDVGLLRVGSSKASGRLSLVKPPQAVGPHADQLNALSPMQGTNWFNQGRTS